MLIHCLLLHPLYVGFLLVLVLLYSAQCPPWLCNHLDEEERAGCITLIVFLMSCDCKCSVALPRGIVCWSAMCDCGFS